MHVAQIEQETHLLFGEGMGEEILGLLEAGEDFMRFGGFLVGGEGFEFRKEEFFKGGWHKHYSSYNILVKNII